MSNKLFLIPVDAPIGFSLNMKYPLYDNVLIGWAWHCNQCACLYKNGHLMIHFLLPVRPARARSQQKGHSLLSTYQS